MKTFAILFPGQGSQFVGMGADVFEQRPDLLGPAADDALGWSLRSVVTEGPEEELTRTDRAQPALYAISYALWDVLRSGEPGVYHAACEESCSWYELALAVIEYAGLEGVEVEPCTSEEYPRPAQRPAYSVLDCSRLTQLRGVGLAPWQEALKTYLGNEDE